MCLAYFHLISFIEKLVYLRGVMANIYRPNSMSALCYSAFGRGYFRWCPNTQTPKIGSHDILIRVAGASLNHMDYFAAQVPLYRLLMHNTPAGFDLSGTVVETGSKVRDFVAGDRVYGFGRGLAEYATVKPWMIAHCPETRVPLADLAAYPSVATTSLQIINNCWLHRAYPERVKNVVVIGASGGVGSSLLQLARFYGPSDLSLTAVSAGKHEQHCLTKGATRFVDYTKLTKGLSSAIPPKSVDIIIDTVSGNVGTPYYVDEGLKLLNDTGLYVSTNSRRPTDYIGKAVSLMIGMNPINHPFHLFMMNPFRVKYDLHTIAGLVTDGKFSIHIDQRLPFTEAAIREGLTRLEQRHSTGKLVVQISTP